MLWKRHSVSDGLTVERVHWMKSTAFVALLREVTGSSYSRPNIEWLIWLDAHDMIHPSVRETVLPIITAPYVFPDDIILPMLSEYWFDDANKLQRWENILQGVFQ